MVALRVITFSQIRHLRFNFCLMLLNQLRIIITRVKNPNTSPQHNKRKSLIYILTPLTILTEINSWTSSILVSGMLKIGYFEIWSKFYSCLLTNIKLKHALEGSKSATFFHFEFLILLFPRVKAFRV